MRAVRTGLGLPTSHVLSVFLAAGLLTACDGLGLPREASRAGAGLDLTAPVTARATDRDVPAPEVFQLTERGLWDGRPSLGGVWIAHPTARDPERVLIRNTATGAEVVGALFRRERENPGPRFQVSSEAASALGIVAGQPVDIAVTALRVERVEPPRAAPTPEALPATATTPAPTDPATAGAGAPAAPGALQADAADATDAAESGRTRRGLREMFRREPARGTGRAADPVAAPLADPVPVAPTAAPVPLAVPPVAVVPPASAPVETVAITDLDPAPPAPRRGLRDIFRRGDAPGTATAAPAISQTTLAPVAPTAPVAAPVAGAGVGPAGAPVGTAVAPPATIPVAAALPPAEVSPAWSGNRAGAPLAGTAFLAGAEADTRRPARTAPTAARLEDPALIAPEAAAPQPAQRGGLRDMFRRRPAPEAATDATLIPLPSGSS